MNKRQLCIRNLALAAIVLAAGQLAIVPNICQAGPYAPAAGQTGSTAIHMDDSCFVGWATDYVNYAMGSNVSGTWQTPEKALGKAVGSSYDIVSLGRGGEITLTFATAITNGDGYDFATFENSFNDTFLELGYVEVSSNGTNFFRFENDSLTAGSVGGFGAIDPTNIIGYCSKYRQGYGTPFDLSDLAGVSSLLDINNVGYVKIVDIIGDGNYTDSTDDVIYDPYPTSGSAGVDLDAIGVINAVPEPSTLAFFLAGLLCLLVCRVSGRVRMPVKCITLLVLCSMLLSASAVQAESYCFGGSWVDVDYWAGSGSNEALVVIDWNGTNGPYNTPSHAWGYRWEGTEKIVDALAAIDNAGDLEIVTGYGGAFFNDAYYNDLSDGDNHTSAGYTGWWAIATSTDGVDWALNGGIGGNLTPGAFEGMNVDSGAWTVATLDAPFTVPEPSTVVLLLTAVVACGICALRRSRIN